ncbi:uncharacterized protein LOC120213512 isoform X1 [Hibiscus syriacus]|uniref:uncharacterized protein LOC120213512 isoform X1 n=1 Tax=Hibiscus syriacus TaxID=106335 RepID=UPI0019246933|nr:uncharacterized protein LOC120213512 isoform X1 [Hibiscus syriacus]
MVSVSSGMMSTVGVDHTNFENSDLTWKTVSKRNRRGMRRTKESVAAISMTIGLGLANKNARKMENVTVLESERLGVDILGRHFCEKVENVPIKKRRLMFRSPSPPHPMTPCPHLEASEKHVDFQATPDQNCGSSTEQWQQLMKSDCSAKSYAPSIDDEKISDGINGVEDFSGIEILAAAACSDSICNDVTDYEGNPVVEESTQERIQSSVSSILLDETTASLETAYRFPIDSVNESKSEGSSFQDNSFAVLHKIPSDKNTTREGFIPLPDDRLLWDLNVPMDAWPCDGGNVDSQKDSVDNISVRSEEMQTMESQDIKSDTTNEVVSSDVDGGNRMTSELRSMPAGTDDLGTEKQESGYGSQYIKDDTTNGVVSSDIDGGDKMTSDLRSMPVWTDDLSVEEWQSGFDSEYLKNYTTKEVVSSDVGGDNRMTSDSRIMPVGSDNLSTDKQESEGCSGYDSRLQTKEPQDMKNETANEVVSSDVDGGNRMTSDSRTMPVGTDAMPVETDDLSVEKQESEGCFRYDSHLQIKESLDIKDDTIDKVVPSDVDGDNMTASDLRTLPVGTDDLSEQKHECEGCSGYDSHLQTKEPQDIKNVATNEVISYDVGGVNMMTSDLRTMPVGSDDSSTEKQECEGCPDYDLHLQTEEPQDIKDDTTNKVVSSDVNGGNRMTSDERTMPVGTDDLSTEKLESEACSGYDAHLQTSEPQDTILDAMKEEVSSDVDEGNRLTSDMRMVTVGTDDLGIEKQESEECSGYDSHLLTNEPQHTKHDAMKEVVSPYVDGGNRLTSDSRTMLVGIDAIPVGPDDSSTEKPGSEGCSGYYSQFKDGELRESDVQGWEEAEQVDYDPEFDFEEERSFGLEAESGEQELKVERGSNLELTANFKCCESGEALSKNSVSLKIRTVEVSDGETMKIDCLDGSNYDLRVDLSKVSKRELLSCVEGSLSSDVQTRSRFDSFNDSYPRAGRCAGSKKSLGRIDLVHRCVEEAPEVLMFSILQLIIGILSGGIHLFMIAPTVSVVPDQNVFFGTENISQAQTKFLRKLLVLRDLATVLPGNLWVLTGHLLEGDHRLKELILTACIQGFQPQEILVLIGVGLEDTCKGLVEASEMSISCIFLMTARNT